MIWSPYAPNFYHDVAGSDFFCLSLFSAAITKYLSLEFIKKRDLLDHLSPGLRAWFQHLSAWFLVRTSCGRDHMAWQERKKKRAKKTNLLS
jgi:hypothetical protein